MRRNQNAGTCPSAVLIVALLFALSPVAAEQMDYAGLRLAMIEEIQEDVRATALYIDKRSLDERVMQAMASIPRHEFVPSGVRSHAYANRPLPIGYGQTISQPYIVALMSDLLQPSAGDLVLEVGTGSGYQAAVMAHLTKRVYSVEIVPELAERARQTFRTLGLDNIESAVADGYYGWESAAPFDAIIVTAAASHVPPPLIAQLAPGGRMVIPVGNRFQVQQLLLIEKDEGGAIKTRQILPVRFVPLTGGPETTE